MCMLDRLGINVGVSHHLEFEALAVPPSCSAPQPLDFASLSDLNHLVHPVAPAALPLVHGVRGDRVGVWGLIRIYRPTQPSPWRRSLDVLRKLVDREPPRAVLHKLGRPTRRRTSSLPPAPHSNLQALVGDDVVGLHFAGAGSS